MVDLIGKIVIYGGGGLLAIAVVFFAFIGLMFFINFK